VGPDRGRLPGLAALVASGGGFHIMARRKRKVAPKSWYVVQTHQYGEFDARRELARQAYEVAMPLMRLPRNRNGVARVVPLFEGYVFVRECADWWAIRGTRGVSHVLMNCDRPSLIADDEMQFFTDVSVDDLGYYVDPVMKLHSVGDSVSPAHGRFAGLTGKLTEMSADGRCELMFSMMNREVRTREYRVLDLA
jgi:transcription antitermination factor NusG